MFCEKCGATLSDGARFCAACGAAVPEQTVGKTARPSASGPEITPDSLRRSVLAQAIQQEVLVGGRIEAQGDFNAAIRFSQPVNHVLHLLLTLVTFGLWAIYWIHTTNASQKAERTVTLNVDERGNLSRHSANAQEMALRRIQQGRYAA